MGFTLGPRTINFSINLEKTVESVEMGFCDLHTISTFSPNSRHNPQAKSRKIQWHAYFLKVETETKLHAKVHSGII